jgi:hypothetical protein
MWEVSLLSTELAAESHEKTIGTDVGSLVFDENMRNTLEHYMFCHKHQPYIHT